MVTITNVGSTYDAVPASKGLGHAEIDLTNVLQVVFRVRYNKVGTGTLSWQVWNETDGVEIGRIDDSAAAGDNKNQVATFDVALTGIKLIRIRAKSTVAGDDPIYYGSSLRLIR